MKRKNAFTPHRPGRYKAVGLEVIRCTYLAGYADSEYEMRLLCCGKVVTMLHQVVHNRMRRGTCRCHDCARKAKHPEPVATSDKRKAVSPLGDVAFERRSRKLRNRSPRPSLIWLKAMTNLQRYTQ